MHYAMTRPGARPQGRYVRYNPSHSPNPYGPSGGYAEAFDHNPWEAECGRAYPRGHRLSGADKRALPRGAFGLPAQRKYPMPDAVHAANAKARASAALERGYLTRREHRKIVRKADAILRRCGGALAPAIPFRPRRRIAANPIEEWSEQEFSFNPEDDDEDDGYLSESMETLAAYELNPQSYWGAGGGHYHGSRFHAGGGRYLDPRYLGSPYEYHAGGGQRSHGYHPGSGYYANPAESHCRVCGSAYQQGYCPVCDWGYEDEEAYLEDQGESNPPRYQRNPLHYPGVATYGYGHIPYFSPPGPGLIAPLANPRKQTYWGAGGGHYDGASYHAGGGRYLDPRYLGSPYEYHAGGGQRSHGYHPGSGYYANPGDWGSAGSAHRELVVTALHNELRRHGIKTSKGDLLKLPTSKLNQLESLVNSWG